MKGFKKYLRVHWRLVSAIVLGIAAVCFIMLYRLGSLTGGMSENEIQQQLFASSWHNIWNNPLNAPLNIVEWLFLTIIPHHGQTVTRVGSTIFGVLAAAAFAYILRRWYGVRTALYGTALFGLSSWFLHVSRFAGSDIMYLWAIPTLLATHIAWERYAHKPLASFLAIGMLTMLMYIPGMVWLILLSLGLQIHHLNDGWQNIKGWMQRSGLVIFFLILLVPLILAFIRTSSLVVTWLGLPHNLPSLGSIMRGLVHSISFFIFRGPADPQLWLDRLPILGFFTSIMLVLGTIFYAKHARAPRTLLLAGLFIAGAILFALGGPVAISVLVPIVYLIITAGVGFLLHDWLRVFPRNPLARSVGYGLLAIAISLACVYNLRSYFIAWPHNTQTRLTFHNRL